MASDTNDPERTEPDARPDSDAPQDLRPRLSEAAEELSHDLHRSPRPSEVAERADADVDDVIESLGQGPIDQHGRHDARRRSSE